MSRVRKGNTSKATAETAKADEEDARLILEALTAQIPGAVYRLRFSASGDYAFTYVSEGARRLFGLPPDQSLTDAEALFKAVYAEDLAEIKASTRRCNETLERWRQDFRVRRPDGMKWVRGEGTPHRARGGDTVWDGILTDVTDQKAAEERERRLRERISAILESTTDAVFTVDSDWRFTYMNRRAREALAHGKDVIGRNGWQVFPEAVGTMLWEQYQRVRDEGCTAEFEIYYPPLEKWLEVHAYPLEGGVAVLFRDISDRRQAEEELRLAKDAAEAAGRAKSAFLAAMSHELRTPLNAICGFSEMIAREVLGPVGISDYREYARDIETSSRQLLHVVSDVLDLARLEAGAGKLDEETVDLVEVLDEALEPIAQRVDEKRLVLEKEVPADCPYLRGDTRALKQILTHLLSNAVKFTEEGVIGVEVRARPEGLALSVRDTGIGIGPEQRQLLCQPFQQIDASLARRHQGAGIGLALTKRLVELHGARLEILSARDVGTTVTVYFPQWRVVGKPDC